MDYNTQDLSGIPADDAMVQLQLKRKLAMADALRNQEAPQGQMVSGRYVAPSWTQQLAGLANKYIAGKQENEAMKQYGQAQQAKQAKLADLLAGKPTEAPMDYNEADNMPGMMQTTRTPYNQQEFMTKAVGVMPELAPQLIQSQIAQYGKEDTPIVAGPGSIGFNRKGEKIFEVPNKPEKPQAPVVRNMRVGNQDVTQQWDADKGKWTEVARGNAFKPGGDNENKAPSGYRFNPNGTLEPIKGGPADQPIKFTADERKANTLLTRMEGSLAQLNQAVKETPNAAKPELLPEAIKALTFGASGPANAATSSGRQRVEAAQLDVIDAALTLGTGAAYTKEQLEGYRKSYFPQIGDTDAQIKDKTARRENLINAAKIAAGKQNTTLPPSAPPIALPRLNTGKPNESSLKEGIVYDLGNGKSGAWNPKTRTFD